jgi:hypothetical protein
MAREEEISEAPNGGGTTTVPSPPAEGASGNEDIDLQTLSCSELVGLFGIVRQQILDQIVLLEDTSRWRFLQRRTIQMTIDDLWRLANGIQYEHLDRGCPGSLVTP